VQSLNGRLDRDASSVLGVLGLPYVSWVL